MERRVRVASMNHLQAPEHDFVQKKLDAFLSGGRPFMIFNIVLFNEFDSVTPGGTFCRFGRI